MASSLPNNAMKPMSRFHLLLVLATVVFLRSAYAQSACCEDPAQPAKTAEHSARSLKANQVSFYAVPLVCPAAHQIGCGSASKPILLALENSLPGAEAWLNRSGTIVAVVWSKQPAVGSQASTLKGIFSERDIPVRKLTGKTRKQALADFQSGTGWYRGAEVDRLSEEEAGVIAARWVGKIRDKIPLADPKPSLLQEGFTDVLKRKLAGQITRAEARDEMLKVCQAHLDESEVKLLLAAFKTELNGPDN
jgi:hypothetical protein